MKLQLLFRPCKMLQDTFYQEQTQMERKTNMQHWNVWCPIYISNASFLFVLFDFCFML